MKRYFTTLFMLMSSGSIAQNWGDWIAISNGIEVSFQFSKTSCASVNTKARLRNTSPYTYREVKVSFNSNCINQTTESIDAYGFAAGEIKESPEDVYTTSLNVTNIVLAKLTDQQYKSILGVSESGNSTTNSELSSIKKQAAPTPADNRQRPLDQEQQYKRLEKAPLTELLDLAEQGNVEAQYQLGLRWMKPGSDQNYAQALSWLRRAADQRHALAQIKLGEIYYQGLGVAKNRPEAESWYLKAVDNALESQKSLAYMSLIAFYLHDPASKDKMINYVTLLDKSAQEGSPKACEHIAALYYSGIGVTKDLNKSAFWYRKAVKQDELASASAQYNLGILYYNGEGVPKDYNEAAIWISKAAAKEALNAYIALYQMHLNGQGYVKDSTEALRWLQKAVEQDSPEAQFQLGMANLDYGKATDGAFWLEKSANQNYLKSMVYLSWFYARGYYINGKKLVLQPDVTKSRYWYTKVISLGTRDALREGIEIITTLYKHNLINKMYYKQAKELYDENMKKQSN